VPPDQSLIPIGDFGGAGQVTDHSAGGTHTATGPSGHTATGPSGHIATGPSGRHHTAPQSPGRHPSAQQQGRHQHGRAQPARHPSRHARPILGRSNHTSPVRGHASADRTTTRGSHAVRTHSGNDNPRSTLALLAPIDGSSLVSPHSHSSAQRPDRPERAAQHPLPRSLTGLTDAPSGWVLLLGVALFASAVVVIVLGAGYRSSRRRS
jgi:hypothetical protein